MDCGDFDRRLPDALAEVGNGGDRARQHAESCEECARRLARARLLGAVVRGLPRPAVPHGVLESARMEAARRIPRLLFARVAAAVLILAAGGLGLHLMLDRDPGYPQLEVEVVVESWSSGGDTDVPLDWMYGPDVPILTADGGTTGE